jgi:3-oxoacyl-[acyl-carrier protein] reductase
MMNELKGRVALVTGASRGIGRSIAIALAAAGCHVAVNYRAERSKAEEALLAIRALKVKAIAVAGDVSKPDDVAAMVSTVERGLGPIDVLVNNAGISVPYKLEALDLAAWDQHFAINVRSAFMVTNAVYQGMRARKWGRLIYVSSIAARLGGIVGPHYSASKAAVEGLMHSYAATLAREGITANAISPCLIETDMLAGNDPAVVAAAVAQRVPVGRTGKADEIGELVVAVASNGFVTGQTFHANGGAYMT